MKIAAITLSMLLFAVTVSVAQSPNETEPPLPDGAVARLGTLRLRHSGEAFSVDFSPDGKTLAAASRNGQAFLWNVESGRRLRVLQPKAGPKYLMALAFSPDGKTLAVDAMEGDILFFDPETGKEMRSLYVKGGGLGQNGCITFSPNGKMIAVARETDFALVDVETGKVVFRHESRAEIQDLAFSADDKKLLVGTINPGAQIWDLATKKSLHNLDAQKIGFTAAFSPDGKWVATGAAEIILWNAETGKEEFRLSGDDPGELFLKLAFTPDGKSLIAGSQECSVYEWDLKTRTQTQKFDGKMNVLRSIAVSRDASMIAASFTKNAIRLWDRKSGKMLCADKPAHTAQVEMVAFSPDGKTLLTGSGNQTIHMWESPSGRQVRTLESQNSANLSAYSPDQKYLATAWKWSAKIQIWNAKTGNHLRELDAGGARLKGVAFSEDGNEVFAVSSPQKSNSASLSRWNVETGKLLKRIEHEGRYYSLWLAISRDGKWAAVGPQNAIELWNLDTGQIAARLTDVPEYVLAVDITPDSNFLVAGSHDKSITIWEMATGKKVLTLTGHKRGVSHVAISPDGRTIASGGSEQFPLSSGDPHKIRYWDLYTGKELPHHTGHDDNTTALAFSPDGKYLATGLRDTTALIWEVPESVRKPAKPTKSPTNVELTSAWQDLRNDNAEKAYQAMAVLTSAENAAVVFLKEHLKPMEAVDRKQVQELLKKLGNDVFAVRSRAQEELYPLADVAKKAIEEFADNAESLEAKKRARAILETLEAPFVTGPDRLRNLRAIQVLGRIGTPEASALLEKLSEGTASARETQKAKRQLKSWRR